MVLLHTRYEETFSKNKVCYPYFGLCIANRKHWHLKALNNIKKEYFRKDISKFDIAERPVLTVRLSAFIIIIKALLL